MLPTNINILTCLILVFILRYIVLQYAPKIIINGYISIFLCFLIITNIFTNNIIFSIIIGLLVVNFRILYRYSKDKKTLSDYNSFSNCAIFLVAFIIWTIIIKNFNKIDKSINKYYDYLLILLLLIYMGSLQIHPDNFNLLYYP